MKHVTKTIARISLVVTLLLGCLSASAQQFTAKGVVVDSNGLPVIGAGVAGAVAARKLAEEAGKKVLIIERRNHIGGKKYEDRYNLLYG